MTDLREAAILAYGHLWHVNTEPLAPIPMRSPEEASYAARKLLRDLLTSEERGRGINEAGRLIGRYSDDAAALAALPLALKEEAGTDFFHLTSAGQSSASTMPTLPQSLLNTIGEYGLARTDGVGEIERMHRWELLIVGIKEYAAAQVEASQDTKSKIIPESSSAAAPAQGERD